MEKTRYQEKHDGKITCTLCPHTCTLNPGETGKCRVRENIDGELYSTVYGKPTAINIDPIEKKPLFHFLPGARAYSIGTAGCNQSCTFCQNWRMSQKSQEDIGSIDLPPEKAVENAKRQNAPIIAYTYNEPTVYMEYMQDIAEIASQNNLKNVAVTCGLVNKKPLMDLTPNLDAANIDLKYFSDELYREISGGYLKPVLETIKTLKEEDVWIEITNLVIPGLNDDEDMITDMCEWIVNNVGKDVPLHLSRFHPAYRMKDKTATALEKVRKAKDIAEETGLKYVYMGNVPTAKTKTKCPNCENLLIEREGYKIMNKGIREGKCIQCEEEILGVWGE